MSIAKLTAGAKGAAGNSTGAQVAETVNALVDKSKGKRDFDLRIRPSGFQGFCYFWNTNLDLVTGDTENFLIEQYPF